MPQRHKHTISPGWLPLIIIFALVDLGLLIKRLIHGHNFALFNPQGLIANEQHQLMMKVFGVLLVIAVPAIFMLYYTAWKYRESNTKVKYEPNHKRSKLFTIGLWMIPVTFLVVLASIMIPATHKLAVQKAIASSEPPLTIQVVAMRWKWLFIYPAQGIASVNYVQLPVNVPVQFELTSDEAPMNSFWVPNLGGQLYTMTGHVNRLNLMATNEGDYPGRAAEISGAGFSGMTFTARASNLADFSRWVQTVKQSPNMLDINTYNKLLMPSTSLPPAFYSSIDPDIYAQVLVKYTGQIGSHSH